MPNLLLELFSEEIPAGMQSKAEAWLAENLKAKLAEAKLTHTGIECFHTPRRLALRVNGLPAQQPDTSTERKGPAITAPEKALEGFLRSTGLTKEQCEIREIKGVSYYFAVINEKGKPTAEALKPLIEATIAALPWPKSMRWGDYDHSWARPLQNICCLLDSEVIPITFGHLTANNQTYGHRFHAAEVIHLSNPAEYESLLRQAKVIADATKRKALISQGLNAALNGTTIIEDEALLNEVTGLVEWPVILKGKIDDAFMQLPPEVMRSEMRNHQKYFTLLNQDGTAANEFLIVSNIEAIDGGKAVISGNERVLRARLSDGQFFYEQDQKHSLDSWNEKLESVTFHAKLGSVADKVQRVVILAGKIAETLGYDSAKAKRAALLCKADLATGMVGEFPELQGIMGRYYALSQGEDAAIADAIRDHYLPQGPHSVVPTQPLSIAVALADKIDTLQSLFSAGEIPTGSKDPFALRRAALGVIRIILENNLHLSLWEGSKSSISGEGQIAPLKTTSPLLEGAGMLKAFTLDRLRGVLKDQSIRYDVIEAVLNKPNASDDMLQLAQQAEALQSFLADAQSEALLAGYRRAANILAAEQKKAPLHLPDSVNKQLLAELSEQALQASLHRISSASVQEYTEQLKSLASLRDPVDAFFDNVMVNSDDAAIRLNRLKLLDDLVSTLNQTADFSQIQQAA